MTTAGGMLSREMHEKCSQSIFLSCRTTEAVESEEIGQRRGRRRAAANLMVYFHGKVDSFTTPKISQPPGSLSSPPSPCKASAEKVRRSARGERAVEGAIPCFSVAKEVSFNCFCLIAIHLHLTAVLHFIYTSFASYWATTGLFLTISEVTSYSSVNGRTSIKKTAKHSLEFFYSSTTLPLLSPGFSSLSNSKHLRRSASADLFLFRIQMRTLLLHFDSYNT